MSQLPASAGYTGVKPYRPASSGRTVLVNSQHKHMLDSFWSLSNENGDRGYHAKAIKRAVEDLRGCTSPVNSFMKEGNPNRRCITHAGFEIEYELGSYYGGPQTDVTIIDIRQVRQRKHRIDRAALWNVDIDRRGRWESNDAPITALDQSKGATGSEEDAIKVGINGYCNDIDHAAGMLASHISRGETTKLDALERSGYTLFYIPQDHSAFKAGWKFLRDLRGISPKDLEASRILSEQMKYAHEKNLYVEWTSHRGGSKVFTKAMEILAQKNVKLEGRQKVFLSDHTSSHYRADIARRSIGMNINESKWHNSTPGIAQKIGANPLGSSDILCSINELKNHTSREEAPGKFVRLIGKGVKSWKNTAAIYGTAGGLATAMGINAAFATAILAALESSSKTIMGSIPSLNENYHKDSLNPAANLANKALAPRK